MPLEQRSSARLSLYCRNPGGQQRMRGRKQDPERFVAGDRPPANEGAVYQGQQLRRELVRMLHAESLGDALHPPP